MSTPGHLHCPSQPVLRGAALTSRPSHGCRAFGSPLSHVPHVPTARSLTALPACSTRWFASLLHPATDHGVHRVSVPRRWLRRHHFPSDATPSRAFPTHKAVPASPLAVSLLSLPSASRTSRGRRDFRALLLVSVRCPPPTVASWRGPVALLGFPLWSHMMTVCASPLDLTRQPPGG